MWPVLYLIHTDGQIFGSSAVSVFRNSRKRSFLLTFPMTCILLRKVSAKCCTCAINTAIVLTWTRARETPYDLLWKTLQINTGRKVRISWNQLRAEVWWCPGRKLDCMPPYQILVLSRGVWWSLLLDIRCLWRHIHVCNPTFWPTLLTKHAYYFALTLLTHCCTMCHCNEHKLLSRLQVRRLEQSTALNASGVSGVWQAWHVPWVPLWRGAKIAWKNLKSFFTVS